MVLLFPMSTRILGIAFALLLAGRAAAAPTLTFETVGSFPGTRVVQVTHAGDERLFIVLRNGQVRVHDGTQVLSTPFLDLSSSGLDLVGTFGEGGLLSIAFPPDHVSTGHFFVSYTDKGDGDEIGDSVIERFTVSNDPNVADLASRTTVLGLEQDEANHNGGQIAFGPDGFLYIGFGDGGGGGDTRCRAQQPDTWLGKMLRIDVATLPYQVPPTNPFVGAGDPLDEIWAFGLRNPWRFSFDRETGDLFIGDVGQDHREEISHQPAGAGGGRNYGWRILEGTFCHDDDASNDPDCPAGLPSCAAAATQYTGPIVEYAHSPKTSRCSVTGGFRYRGSRIDASPSTSLRGTYVFGDLCTGEIFGATNGAGGWTMAGIPAPPAGGLTGFGEDVRGELYVGAGSTAHRIRSPNEIDEIDSPGLHDAASGTFFLRGTLTSGAADAAFGYGAGGGAQIGLRGDWDGDRREGVGAYDGSAGSFFLRNAASPGAANHTFFFGPAGAGWIPVIGDWNGDGKDGVGLFDPANAVFFLRTTLSSGPAEVVVPYGPPGSGWQPIVGDWNASGRDGVGLFDPGTSTFFLRNALSGGPADTAFGYGAPAPNRRAIVGDWTGDGGEGVGIWDREAAILFLRSSPSPGPADHTLSFGAPGTAAAPLGGNWDLP